MEWFLYDNDLRHERVKENIFPRLHDLYLSKQSLSELYFQIK